jgi:hypothetical protein
MDPAKISGTDILIKIIRPLAEGGDLKGAGLAQRVCSGVFRLGLATGLVPADPAAGLPELAHQTITGRLTPVIDPMVQAADSAQRGHPIEARPHHYAVKRNPRLAGLTYDPSRPGSKGE